MTMSRGQFQSRFGQRLRSMALSHDLLVKEDWKRASLLDLVRLQLELFAGPGSLLKMEGPCAYISPDAAQHIGLALHELATNAVKYGAFREPAGTVHVSWSVEGRADEPTLFFRWQERGGPPVAKPSRKGFGSVPMPPVE